MLPKNKRLDHISIKKALTCGRSLHTAHFALRVSSCEGARFGVVVSKKVASSAVARNRLRRRVFGVVRSCTAKNPNVRGNFVIIAKRGAPLLDSEHLEEEIYALFSPKNP